ncbi:glycine oxidase ThiO [Heyndrickxia ginsengihumi]|uniref:glycine oxidase ThiO n=1 Tax=Heyndrickxia ginsengihumi TaxID=363870 RepID=UPI003D1AA314
MYDVIIVGAGVIGSSIAYYLTEQGASVLIIEKDQPAKGASGAAGGMLGAQAEIHTAGPFYEMAQKSREMFPELACKLREKSGIDIGLVQKGLLQVAITDEQTAELETLMTFHQSQGQQAILLNGKDLFDKEPHLGEDIKAGLYLPNDHQVVAPNLAKAFLYSATANGATLLTDTEVVSIIKENGKACGVKAEAQSYFAKSVVIASSIQTPRLLQPFGFNAEVYPVKGECISLRFSQLPIQTTIMGKGCYIVPKRGKRLVIGATTKPHDYTKNVTAGGITSLLTEAMKLVPAVDDGSIEHVWAGHRPQTVDGLPYVGKLERVEELYVACGHYRNGILLSPITGKWMAEMILNHEKHPLLAHFSPQRHEKEVNV